MTSLPTLPYASAHKFRHSNLLRPFPFTRIRGLEYRLDRRHILDGIFERHRNLTLAAHCPRELIALNRILIDNRKLFNLRRSTQHVTDEDSARSVIRCVPWNFNFDAPGGAKEMHSLEEGSLC